MSDGSRCWGDVCSLRFGVGEAGDAHVRASARRVHLSRFAAWGASVLILVPDDGCSNERLGQDSWKKSLLVFDARIDILLLEKSESLRCFRKVIWERYSDFQARLPGCEPPTLFSLGSLEDGTTEDSKYPNLMSPEVRVEYGL